jgi:hypothetical protein
MESIRRRVDLDELRADIDALNGGIDIAGAIFVVFKRHFAIEAGALFLPEADEGYFVPYAMTGFDATTAHRFRPPLNFFASVAAPAADESFLALEGAKLDRVRRLFSVTGFAGVRKILFLIAGDSGSIATVLSVVDSVYLDRTHMLLVEAWRAVRDKVCSLVGSARNATMERLSELPAAIVTMSQDAERKVEDFFNQLHESERHGLALFVSTDDIIAAVDRVSSADMDPFRLKTDVLRVMASLAGNGGIVIDAGADVLILMEGRDRFDADLIREQFSLTLRRLIRGLNDDFVLQPLVTHLPEDENELLELLKRAGR